MIDASAAITEAGRMKLQSRRKNGERGTRDIEGKATRVGVSEAGKRTSFKDEKEAHIRGKKTGDRCQMSHVRGGTAANSMSDPRRVFPAVENRPDTNHVLLDTVINRKRKAFAQAAVISENLGVNTTLSRQGVNIVQE